MFDCESKKTAEAPIGKERLLDMIARWLPHHQVPRRVRVHTDTTDFFNVEYDDVLILKEHPYVKDFPYGGSFL